MQLFGQRFERNHVYTAAILVAAILQIFVSESSKFDLRIYERARPVKEATAGLPVYATGKLFSPEIGSPYLRPGKYLTIDQRSEVYAWNEYSNHKNRLVQGLQWVATPRDPATFSLSDHRGEKFFRKKIDAQPVSSADAHLSVDGKDYALDLLKVDLTLDIAAKKPELKDVLLSDFKVPGSGDLEIPDRYYMYETKECATTPSPGCQRIHFNFVALPESTVTVIGDLKEGRLIPFRGRLILGPGDFKAAVNNAYMGTGYETYTEVLLFFAIWFAFYMSRDLLDLSPFLQKLTVFRKTLLCTIIAAVIFIAAYKIWFITAPAVAIALFFVNKRRLAKLS